MYTILDYLPINEEMMVFGPTFDFKSYEPQDRIRLDSETSIGQIVQVQNEFWRVPDLGPENFYTPARDVMM